MASQSSISSVQDPVSILAPKDAALFKNMMELYNFKNYKKALKVAETILIKYPNHGETLSVKALLTLFIDPTKEDEIVDLAKRGLRNGINSYLCWHVLGVIYKQLKKYKETVKCFVMALKLDPYNDRLIKEICCLQIELKDYCAFRRFASSQLKLKSKEYREWVMFAFSQHLCGNLMISCEILEEADNLFKPNYKVELQELSESIMYRAMLYEHTGQFIKCAKLLEEKSNFLKDNLTRLELKAKSLYLSNTRSACNLTCKELLKINPNNARFVLLYLMTHPNEKIRRLFLYPFNTFKRTDKGSIYDKKLENDSKNVLENTLVLPENQNYAIIVSNEVLDIDGEYTSAGWSLENRLYHNFDLFIRAKTLERDPQYMDCYSYPEYALKVSKMLDLRYLPNPNSLDSIEEVVTVLDEYLTDCPGIDFVVYSKYRRHLKRDKYPILMFSRSLTEEEEDLLVEALDELDLKDFFLYHCFIFVFTSGFKFYEKARKCITGSVDRGFTNIFKMFVHCLTFKKAYILLFLLSKFSEKLLKRQRIDGLSEHKMVKLAEHEVSCNYRLLLVILLLAKLYDFMGAFNKAIELLNLGYKLSPTSIDILCTRGKVYRHIGNYKASNEDFCRGTDIDRSDRQTNAKAAKSTLRTMDFEASVTRWKSFLTEDICQRNDKEPPPDVPSFKFELMYAQLKYDIYLKSTLDEEEEEYSEYEEESDSYSDQVDVKEGELKKYGYDQFTTTSLFGDMKVKREESKSEERISIGTGDIVKHKRKEYQQEFELIEDEPENDETKLKGGEEKVEILKEEAKVEIKEYIKDNDDVKTEESKPEDDTPKLDEVVEPEDSKEGNLEPEELTETEQKDVVLETQLESRNEKVFEPEQESEKLDEDGALGPPPPSGTSDKKDELERKEETQILEELETQTYQESTPSEEPKECQESQGIKESEVVQEEVTEYEESVEVDKEESKSSTDNEQLEKKEETNLEQQKESKQEEILENESEDLKLNQEPKDKVEEHFVETLETKGEEDKEVVQDGIRGSSDLGNKDNISEGDNTDREKQEILEENLNSEQTELEGNVESTLDNKQDEIVDEVIETPQEDNNENKHKLFDDEKEKEDDNRDNSNNEEDKDNNQILENVVNDENKENKIQNELDENLKDDSSNSGSNNEEEDKVEDKKSKELSVIELSQESTNSGESGESLENKSEQDEKEEEYVEEVTNNEEDKVVGVDESHLEDKEVGEKSDRSDQEETKTKVDETEILENKDNQGEVDEVNDGLENVKNEELETNQRDELNKLELKEETVDTELQKLSETQSDELQEVEPEQEDENKAEVESVNGNLGDTEAPLPTDEQGFKKVEITEEETNLEEQKVEIEESEVVQKQQELVHDEIEMLKDNNQILENVFETKGEEEDKDDVKTEESKSENDTPKLDEVEEEIHEDVKTLDKESEKEEEVKVEIKDEVVESKEEKTLETKKPEETPVVEQIKKKEKKPKVKVKRETKEERIERGQKCLKEAFEKYRMILEKHSEIYQNQLDFHNYCLNRLSLRVYYNFLKLRTVYCTQGYFIKALKGMIRCSLEMNNLGLETEVELEPEVDEKEKQNKIVIRGVREKKIIKEKKNKNIRYCVQWMKIVLSQRVYDTGLYLLFYKLANIMKMDVLFKLQCISRCYYSSGCNMLNHHLIEMIFDFLNKLEKYNEFENEMIKKIINLCVDEELLEEENIDNILDNVDKEFAHKYLNHMMNRIVSEKYEFKQVNSLIICGMNNENNEYFEKLFLDSELLYKEITFKEYMKYRRYFINAINTCKNEENKEIIKEQMEILKHVCNEDFVVDTF